MEIKFFRDDCIRSPAQQWVIDPDSSEVRVGGRNCLDAKTGKSFWQPNMQVSKSHSWIVNTGSPVVIWQCNGNPWQQWVFRNGGTLTLASNQSASLTPNYISTYSYDDSDSFWLYLDLCLDVPNSSNNNGVQVQTYACNGGRNQLWYSRPAF